jgi:hypothetical protein
MNVATPPPWAVLLCKFKDDDTEPTPGSVAGMAKESDKYQGDWPIIGKHSAERDRRY